MVHLDNLKIPKAVEKNETTARSTGTAGATADESSGAVEPNSETASGMSSTKPDTVEPTVDKQDSSMAELGPGDLKKQESISEDSAPPEPIRKENVSPGPASTTLVKQNDSRMHLPAQELSQQENGIPVDLKSVDAVPVTVSSDALGDTSRPEPEQLKPKSAGSVSQWQSYAAKPPDFQVRCLTPPHHMHVDIVVAFARRRRSHELFLSFGCCKRYLGSF